ncbi:hypothetical protein lerEdw1_017247 [Lerista edwardsae]|nr:hypothetical protein lerEdw1_017247 [Lerista edwardsae]
MFPAAGQFSGISSPEMYRQALLAGCRCVELDCWKGRPPDEEPYITHGFTMTTEILFKDVIEAIAESAFKTSPYPLILSFENHVDSPKQQAKMAEYCRTIFGDMLLTEPLEKFPLKPGVPLPSPQDLLGKILIKNKKNQFAAGENQDTLKKDTLKKEDEITDQLTSTDRENTARAGEVTEETAEAEGDLENLDEEEMKKLQSDEGTAGLEVTAYEEMSSLVNYIQPIKFECFEISAQKNRSFVVSSFTELKAYELLTKSPIQFVDYNKRQMSRIYPKGTRMDSSNYMPQMFWNVGCQMVALNFQTTDVPMQQNMALFEFNGQSGYLLKHDFMRRQDKQFDPFSVDRIDVVVASTLSITASVKHQIISGQFLSERCVRSYVEAELFGLPGDPKRKYRTKLCPSANSINPLWKEDAFVFEKIMMPELASLRIVALEEGGKFIGQRIIPITAVRSGYHHICLRSESNMPLTMPSLFVYVEMKDYVPDSWADLTMALSNPIKFFNAHDKKSAKSQETNSERPSLEKSFSLAQLTTNGIPNATGTFSVPPSNEPAGTLATGKEETIKEPAKGTSEPQTASLEELQQMKNFGKLLKKQEKELKELERKMVKRREEVLQKYAVLFMELVDQTGKKKMLNPKKKSCRKVASDETKNAAERVESPDNRVLELKEKLEEELIQLGEELYDVIRKKKEQQATEQIAKVIELAREKQAAELKALKESSESDTKEMKKKLEAKRLDRIQAVAKTSNDKGAQERSKREINNAHIQEVVQMVKLMNEKQARYQELLETKQTACLETIKEKENQLQQEAFAEYEEKVKALSAEVQDLVKNCVKVYFPLEAEVVRDEAPNAAGEEDPGLPPLQESQETPEIARLETQLAESVIEEEKCTEHQDSRL